MEKIRLMLKMLMTIDVSRPVQVASDLSLRQVKMDMGAEIYLDQIANCKQKWIRKQTVITFGPSQSFLPCHLIRETQMWI